MTASRRLALLEWARRSGAWIIEDDYDSEYRYASRPLGALQGLDSGGRVIYMGSFSKVLFPALRIGYLVVPAPLAAAFRQVRESLDLFPPVLDQLVLTEFLSDGHLARHIRRMRKVYLARRDALLAGLRAHAPQLEPGNADAGLHLTAFLAGDDRQVVAAAAKEGLSATALSTCYLQEPRNGLILGFGGGTERQITEACRRLGRIL
jgi:GntR family transcriptional regulator/MocR family aminotransferase